MFIIYTDIILKLILFLGKIFRNKYFLGLLKKIKLFPSNIIKTWAFKVENILDPNFQTIMMKSSFVTYKPRIVYYKNANGILWKLNINDHVDYRLYLNDVWDADLIKISENILKYKKDENIKTCCIDIGAHIGTWSIPVSCLCDLVVSFEPASLTFSRLNENIALNKIRNIFPLRFAFSSQNSILKLNFNTKGNSGKSSLIKNWSESNELEEQIIGINPTSILNQIAHIAMIKIDVEGYEFEVITALEKLIEIKKPVLIFEWRYDNYQNIFEKSELNEKIKDLLLLFERISYVPLSIDLKNRKFQPFNSEDSYENAYCIHNSEIEAISKVLFPS